MSRGLPLVRAGGTLSELYTTRGAKEIAKLLAVLP